MVGHSSNTNSSHLLYDIDVRTKLTQALPKDFLYERKA